MTQITLMGWFHGRGFQTGTYDKRPLFRIGQSGRWDYDWATIYAGFGGFGGKLVLELHDDGIQHHRVGSEDDVSFTRWTHLAVTYSAGI